MALPQMHSICTSTASARLGCSRQTNRRTVSGTSAAMWPNAASMALSPYPSDPTPDPVCQDYAHGHVVRGGSWQSNPLDLRVTARFGEPHSARDDRTGFRVALDAVEPQ